MGAALALVFSALLLGCSQAADVPDIVDDPPQNWSYGYGGMADNNYLVTSGSVPCYAFAPYDYSSIQGWPLLLYLHDGLYGGTFSYESGWSGNGDGDWTALANAEGFIFAVPGVYEWTLEHSWDQETSDDDIADTLQLLTQNFNVDLNHIHVIGAGWGGHAAERFAFTDPEDVASFGVHSAGLDPEYAAYPEVPPERRAPFYITHHPYNAVIDIQNSIDLEEILRENGHRVERDDELGELPGQNHRFTPHVAAMHWDMARAWPYVD